VNTDHYIAESQVGLVPKTHWGTNNKVELDCCGSGTIVMHFWVLQYLPKLAGSMCYWWQLGAESCDLGITRCQEVKSWISWVLQEHIQTYPTHLIAVGVAGRLNLDQIVAKLGGNGRDIALLEKMSWSEHRPIPCIKLCLKGPQNAFGYKRQSVIWLLWFWQSCPRGPLQPTN
jgi:hypothetical protein